MTHLPTGLRAESHHRASLGANTRLSLRQLAGRLFRIGDGCHDGAGRVMREVRTIAASNDLDTVLDGDLIAFIEARLKRGA